MIEKISKLAYINKEGETSPIPGWCHFLIKLGFYIGQKNKTENTLCFVAGITAPTRAFLSAFAATGVIMARTSLSCKNLAKERFQQLCSLKKGTKVIFRENKRKKVGFFNGTEHVKSSVKSLNKVVIRVSVPNKVNTTYLFTP